MKRTLTGCAILLVVIGAIVYATTLMKDMSRSDQLLVIVLVTTQAVCQTCFILNWAHSKDCQELLNRRVQVYGAEMKCRLWQDRHERLVTKLRTQEHSQRNEDVNGQDN